MARLTREQSQALTRSKMLASAAEVVAREGYEGASIDKIAEAAGFSKGAFYSNFASKEELFLELLENHAGQDVVQLRQLLAGVATPAEVIERIVRWANDCALDPTWGLLALELFRRARRDATFGDRHATLFSAQWEGLGEILLTYLPDKPPVKPAVIGGLVLELTYGAASSFSNGMAPSVGDLVRLALTSLFAAHGALGAEQRPPTIVAPRTKSKRAKALA